MIKQKLRWKEVEIKIKCGNRGYYHQYVGSLLRPEASRYVSPKYRGGYLTVVAAISHSTITPDECRVIGFIYHPAYEYSIDTVNTGLADVKAIKIS